MSSTSSVPTNRKGEPLAFSCVNCTIRDNVLYIELNRPKRKNAFNMAMYSDLFRAMQWASKSLEINVVVITGNPTSTPHEFFSSGNDLNNYSDAVSKGKAPEIVAREIDQMLRGFVEMFIYFPKVLIAAVNGPAFGIAVTLLALFDFVYAKDTANFTTPFTRLAMSPEGCSTYTFPRMFGHKANDLLLMSETISAKE
jgi:peroxisomal 3,2-trans-enoyl-CoA isomerase